MNQNLFRPAAARAAAGLFISLLAFAAAPLSQADDWSPNLTATATWQNNATNAELDGDKVDGLQSEWDLVASQRYALGATDSFHPTLHLGAEWWPKFDGLSRGLAGVQGEWRHTFGTGTVAPVLFAGAAGDAVWAEEAARRGTSARLWIGVRKRFNDLWQAKFTQEYTRHDARYVVFDQRSSETALEVSRELNSMARFSFTFRYRTGDVLTYASGSRPDLEALAPNRLEWDTFGRPMTIYSVDARTLSGRAAVISALDEHAAVVAAYEYRKTQRSPLNATNHLFSLGLVYQF